MIQQYELFHIPNLFILDKSNIKSINKQAPQKLTKCKPFIIKDFEFALAYCNVQRVYKNCAIGLTSSHAIDLNQLCQYYITYKIP